MAEAKQHRYRTIVDWLGNRGSGTSGYRDYDRAFQISSGRKPVIAGSSDPAFQGDAGRWNPEELLVASLSSCHKLWYLHLCAVAGIRVLAYRDEAEGTMLEDAAGGGRFARVLLRPEVTITAGDDAVLAERLHHDAHAECFIARSVDFPVVCEAVTRSERSRPRAAPVALVVVDVQRAFDEWEAAGLRRNNPGAEAKIGRLIAAFRAGGAPILHIRHASTDPESRLRPDLPGYAPKDEAREAQGEPVLVKRVNSAFIGTDLEARLRAAGVRTVVICGATTNHCVETTTRMAGNLGFAAQLVRDACWTFDRTGPDGDHHRAEDLHATTLANLSGEFAAVVTTDDVVAGLA